MTESIKQKIREANIAFEHSQKLNAELLAEYAQWFHENNYAEGDTIGIDGENRIVDKIIFSINDSIYENGKHKAAIMPHLYRAYGFKLKKDGTPYKESNELYEYKWKDAKLIKRKDQNTIN